MGERREDVAQPLGAADGVELAPALREPGRCVEVVVGAEGDDEDVRLVDSSVGRHPPRLWIDRGDRLAHEADTGLGEVGIRQANLAWRLAPEHHVELRVAEDEGVVLVDQRDAGVAPERLGQESRELETAEARTQNDEACLHRTNANQLWALHRERSQPDSNRPANYTASANCSAITGGSGSSRRRRRSRTPYSFASAAT